MILVEECLKGVVDCVVFDLLRDMMCTSVPLPLRKQSDSRRNPASACSEAVCSACNRTVPPAKRVIATRYVLAVEHACALCQDQTGALHMFCDTKESESCLVKASAKHASESVLVIGELLCTGVQANTERHTRKETREMCSCWGYKQQSSSHKSGEWRDSNFQ